MLYGRWCAAAGALLAAPAARKGGHQALFAVKPCRLRAQRASAQSLASAPNLLEIKQDAAGCRDGLAENALQEVVRCCQRPLPEKGGVKPTQLFSRNADVDRVNTAELMGLAYPQASPQYLSWSQHMTPWGKICNQSGLPQAQTAPPATANALLKPAFSKKGVG